MYKSCRFWVINLGPVYIITRQGFGGTPEVSKPSIAAQGRKASPSRPTNHACVFGCRESKFHKQPNPRAKQGT